MGLGLLWQVGQDVVSRQVVQGNPCSYWAGCCCSCDAAGRSWPPPWCTTPDSDKHAVLSQGSFLPCGLRVCGGGAAAGTEELWQAVGMRDSPAVDLPRLPHSARADWLGPNDLLLALAGLLPKVRGKGSRAPQSQCAKAVRWEDGRMDNTGCPLQPQGGAGGRHAWLHYTSPSPWPLRLRSAAPPSRCRLAAATLHTTWAVHAVWVLVWVLVGV